MNKNGLILMLILLLPVFTFGQRGDTRTNGMANAFTALADDANALFFNPAGLVFLKKPYINWGLDYINNEWRRLLAESDYLPTLILNIETGYYEYRDPVTDELHVFEPDDFDFYYSSSDMEQYYAACAAYETWADYYRNSSGMVKAIEYLTLSRLLCADKNWGFAFLNNASRIFAFKEFVTIPSPPGGTMSFWNHSFTVLRDVGVVIGHGFELDPLALGVNIKLFQEKSDFFTIKSSEFIGHGDGVCLFPTLFGTMEEKVIGWRMEGGAGALLPLDFLTLGLYIDKILNIRIDGLTGQFQLDLSGIYETLNLGFSLSPFNWKRSNSRSFLNLNINGDLKNIGSNLHRTACLGIEAGINLADLLAINLRGGIFSGIKLDPKNIMNLFSFDDDILTYGVGIKILFLQFNYVLESPFYVFHRMFTDEYKDHYLAIINDVVQKVYFNIEFAY